jgi:hypothetical protein
MSVGEVQTKTQMTIGKGFGIYTALLAVLIVLIKLSGSLSGFPGIIPFAFYLVAGFMLNRIVLRGLIEWHPVYNTLDNVSSGKLRSLILWPLVYPSLFFKLGVVKHL